jgi:hypothetical protein
MPKTIQLRNVPDKLHRKLNVRAASVGMTLSNFLIRELGRVADSPIDEMPPRLTDDEVIQRLKAQPSVKLKVSPAKIIREMRGR